MRTIVDRTERGKVFAKTIDFQSLSCVEPPEPVKCVHTHHVAVFGRGVPVHRGVQRRVMANDFLVLPAEIEALEYHKVHVQEDPFGIVQPRRLIHGRHDQRQQPSPVLQYGGQFFYQQRELLFRVAVVAEFV